MFGRKTEEQKQIEHVEHMRELEKRGLEYFGKYIEGLPMFPVEHKAAVVIYPDRIDLRLGKKYAIAVSIPYADMKEVGAIDIGKKRTKERIATGIILGGPVGLAVGLAWKKQRYYLGIVYADEEGEHTIVMDLYENIEFVQPRIYEHMMKARKEDVVRA